MDLLDITTKCPTLFMVYYALLFLFLYFLPCFLLSLVEMTLSSFSLIMALTNSLLLIHSFFLFFFYHINLFIPTFQDITYNTHPQLMPMTWVDVHNSQDWVRENTSSVFVLATLTYEFLLSWGAHAKGRTRASTLHLGKMSWGRKERSIVSSKYLDQKWPI